MKLIGVEFGRVSLLVDLVDIGTRRGLYLPEAAAMVQHRYQFVHTPSVAPAAQAPQSYRFEHGVMKKSGKEYSYSAFEVHPHGLVVQGNDTNAGEAFLDDFFELGIEHFGMKKPSRPPTKVFVSGLVVEFESDFNLVVKRWQQISELFSAALKRYY